MALLQITPQYTSGEARELILDFAEQVLSKFDLEAALEAADTDDLLDELIYQAEHLSFSETDGLFEFLIGRLQRDR